MTKPGSEWIAVDWGTTHLRCWVVNRSGDIKAEYSSGDGMGIIRREAFESALLKLISAHLHENRQIKVVCCGMVGAQEGWIETEYATLPWTPPGINAAIAAPTKDPRLQVLILPGIKQSNPADVMRGEETQIAGFLSGNPGFKGSLCLPGTHAKWVEVSGGQLNRFTTAMTGDVFAALSKHTLLHRTITKGWDQSAFNEAVNEAFEMPQSILTLLFNLRARGLLTDQSGEMANARLSGLLLGLEFSGVKNYLQSGPVILIGQSALCSHYARALEIIGCKTTSLNGEALVLAGLKAAYSSVFDCS